MISGNLIQSSSESEAARRRFALPLFALANDEEVLRAGEEDALVSRFAWVDYLYIKSYRS